MSFIPCYRGFAWGSRERPNWVLNVPGSQHSWKLWIASPCMPDRLYIKLSQEPWGLEKYSSISRPIGQWSLTHASFNITVINKGRKQILKTWLTAHCLLGWQFWPKVLYIHPLNTDAHTNTHVYFKHYNKGQTCAYLHGVSMTSVTSALRVSGNSV